MSECFDPDFSTKVKDLQESAIFEEFRKNYPKNIENYEKELVECLEESITKKFEEE